ncbi:MAG: rhomboid family intramembrane serine protease [Acidobacteriota bacterium]
MGIFRRQRVGSVVCRSCGLLVGVNDAECYNCGCKNPGLWGFAPVLRQLGKDLGFVNIVTGGCVLLYLATLAVDPSGIRMEGLFSLLAPSGGALFLFGASGAAPFFGAGRWWTVLSAAWLHGGLLHIAFNLLWVRQLAPATAELYGAARTVLIYTVSSVLGFFLSSAVGQYFWFLPGPLRGARMTIGASAPIFGLLGALVYFGRRGGSSHIGSQAKMYAVALGLFGLFFPGIDNWAHLGGFLGGYLTSRWLDPLRPERLDHFVAALACIVLTVLSIFASVVHGLQFF